MTALARAFRFLDSVVGDTTLPLYTFAGAPTSGANGTAANAPQGALLLTTEPAIYENVSSVVGSPTWKLVFSGSVSQILTASVTLSSAQVLALFTTPINLIPAPGAGKLILIDNVTYKGTGAYTQADGAGLVYHGTSTAADKSYSAPANPFINGVTLSGGALAGGVANTSVAALENLGVDVASITTNPTVGTTPVVVTATFRTLAP